MRLRLPKCPECGKKVNWFRAWSVKTQGEFRCGKCGACSNVFLDRLIYMLALIAAIIGAVFFILFIVMVREFNFISLLLIVVPFLIFFFISPFLVRLRPIQKENPKSTRSAPRRTQVFDQVDISQRAAPRRDPQEGSVKRRQP